MKATNILEEIQKIDSGVNKPVSFLAQPTVYTATELNAIRFFALNLLQAKMNAELKKEKKGFVYRNSFNTHLANTKY